MYVHTSNCKSVTVFSSAVVDVSAQGSCTITPINPTTLTTAGGVLPNGTENVMIQCNCSDNYGDVITSLGWWYPDGLPGRRLAPRADPGDGTPYYTRPSSDGNNKNVTLVIPTFNDSYGGNYTCGRRRSGSLISPTASVSLTIGGELIVYRNIINPVSKYYMLSGIHNVHKYNIVCVPLC